MQDHTVGGVVIILISVLGDSAGPHLSHTGEMKQLLEEGHRADRNNLQIPNIPVHLNDNEM